MPTRSENFLLVLKTGRTFPHLANLYGDFEHWLSTGLRAGCTLPIEVLEAQHASTTPQAWPDPRRLAGVVISGSHDMVTDEAAWIQHTAHWLRDVCHADVPVLGICFGHQLLAQALGGQAGNHPRGLELGTVAIETRTAATRDPVWRDMPGTFDAHTVHYQSVLQLPPGATLLAGNAHDHHHAYRWRHNVWGVQFHPEFDARIMQGYIDHLRPNLPPGSMPAPWTSRETPAASRLLPGFARHAQDRVRRQETMVSG